MITPDSLQISATFGETLIALTSLKIKLFRLHTPLAKRGKSQRLEQFYLDMDRVRGFRVNMFQK